MLTGGDVGVAVPIAATGCCVGVGYSKMGDMVLKLKQPHTIDNSQLSTSSACSAYLSLKTS